MGRRLIGRMNEKAQTRRTCWANFTQWQNYSYCILCTYCSYYLGLRNNEKGQVTKTHTKHIPYHKYNEHIDQLQYHMSMHATSTQSDEDTQVQYFSATAGCDCSIAQHDRSVHIFFYRRTTYSSRSQQIKCLDNCDWLLTQETGTL